MSKKILISGYSYIDANSIKTFDYYPDRDGVYFLVPDMWPFKGGKYVMRPPKKENIRTAKAFFYHSNYPVIGGIFKGWMPIFPVVLIKQKPDIVFSVSEPNLLTATYQGIFSKLLGVKLIMFTWENVPYKSKFEGLKGIVQQIIVKLNLFLCDGLICGSHKANQAMKLLINKPMAVISLSGVDTDFFKRDYAKKVFQGRDLKNFVVFSFAGAIAYRKGVHLIVKAFEELSQTTANVCLIIAGIDEGEYGKKIDSMIKESGLGGSIIRVPWLDREGVKELFNSSDIFVYPSIPHGGWEEQLAYSIQEASSMELPIVTTASGSISEVVLDGKTGIIVKSYDDYFELKKAMEILADDKQKRVSMGKAGREFICDTYSHKAVATKFYKFFTTI